MEDSGRAVGSTLEESIFQLITKRHFGNELLSGTKTRQECCFLFDTEPLRTGRKKIKTVIHDNMAVAELETAITSSFVKWDNPGRRSSASGAN